MKNPPHAYLQKLRSYLDPAVTRKVSALANRLSCSTAAALPSPPLSLVQDVPTAEEGSLSEQTAWELKLTVNSENRGRCLSGTPRFKRHLQSCSVIWQKQRFN